MSIDNDTSALVPAVWEAAMQIPLRKSLVALEVCNTELADHLTYGDTIHKGYITEISAVVYTPGTALTPDALTAVDDTITVSTRIAAPFYVDDTDRLQAKPDYAAAWAEDAAYQIRDSIDTEALGEMTAGTDFGESSATTGTYITGSAIQTITASSGIMIKVFADARAALRDMNCEENGDWIAILEPATFTHLELTTVDKGFNMADSALKNGFAGNFMGFKIYVSNNVPTGYAYIGKNKMIDLVMQAGPKMEIQRVNGMLGNYYIAWCLYGKTVFNNNINRFLYVHIASS